MSEIYQCGLFKCVVDRGKLSQQINLLQNKEVIIRPGVMCVDHCPIRRVIPQLCVRISSEKKGP